MKSEETCKVEGWLFSWQFAASPNLSACCGPHDWVQRSPFQTAGESATGVQANPSNARNSAVFLLLQTKQASLQTHRAGISVTTRVHVHNITALLPNTAPSWGHFTTGGALLSCAKRTERVSNQSRGILSYLKGFQYFQPPCLHASALTVGNFRGSDVHTSGLTREKQHIR